jgi:hypothetical protein
MTSTSTHLSVAYGQILVFDRALEQPFNDWTKGHCEQGFSWRPGSVSFATLDEGSQYLLEIVVSEAGEISPAAVRVIQTPFEAPASGSIEIASISDSVFFDLSPGLYQLQFEAFPISDNSETKIRLVFTRSDHPSFKILRADATITARDNLLLSASPAGPGLERKRADDE